MPDLTLQHLPMLANLFIAAVLGGLIGVERELSGKAAGLRTHLLVAMGSALLTDISFKMAAATPTIDPTRIPAQIVSGLGFLGVGAILQSQKGVTGLTTATGLWVSAAVGIATGAGYHIEAIAATVMALVALAVFGRLESWLSGKIPADARALPVLSDEIVG